MKKITYPVLILFLITISFLEISCTSNIADKLIVLKGGTMGTTYSIKVVKDNFVDLMVYSSLPERIDSILVEVNRQMSTYISSSEISHFNLYKKNDVFEVSDDLAMVVSKALEVSRKSDGAFDITIGPLVNLWGFGPVLKVYDVPAEAEIKKIKHKVGYKNVNVSIDPVGLMKNIPDVYCDLSAIAKGFGVDKVAEFLESFEIKNYLVEIGGEVRAKGKNQNDKSWLIGISTPGNDLGIEKVAVLENASMATSGDYRNYFEKDDVRYSHTIDSRTGYPITHKLASVTVIHNLCMMADAFATAINVLGPKEGYELAVKEKLPVFFIIRNNGKFEEKMTPEFKKYLMKK